MIGWSVPNQGGNVEIRKGKDLTPRDPKNIEQLIAISWAEELVRVVLAQENLDELAYYMVRTFYSDRVASLAESNPRDVAGCQLYDILIIREDKDSHRYKWFDTTDDSTIEFLQKLAEEHANPKIYEKSKQKFASVFGRLQIHSKRSRT